MICQRPLAAKELSSGLICFNREVRIVEETPFFCRVRVKLQHRGAAKLYGKFFPLRDYHDYILDGIGLTFFRQFRDRPVSVREAVKHFQDEHKLSYFEALTLIRDYTGRLMRCGIAAIEVRK